jgi:hypothetical protein
LLWQAQAGSDYRDQPAAITECNDLVLCGFSDWTLPTVDQLRTIIRGCPATQTGGQCALTSSCLTDSCFDNCAGCDLNMGPNNGCYLADGLSGACWNLSSTTFFSERTGSTRAITASYDRGMIGSQDVTGDMAYARCVRLWP